MNTRGIRLGLRLLTAAAFGTATVLFGGCSTQEGASTKATSGASNVNESPGQDPQVVPEGSDTDALTLDATGAPMKFGPPARVTVDGELLKTQLRVGCGYVAPLDPPPLQIATWAGLGEVPDPGETTINVEFYSGRPTEVRLVSINGSDFGFSALNAVNPGEPPLHGSATSTMSGDTYTVAGEARGWHDDMHSFEIVATCS